MAKKQIKKLSDQLRATIDASELSRYRIAIEAGLDHGTLSRFMNGKGGLSIDALDRIGQILRLELTPKQKGR
ncbi:MAG: helix-turn-helix domain-containing protein [Planctomycetaceae bacterium]|nr:helix-turn-helix domain-containing protein [Planctomycetaceae bacterium]